MKNQKGERVKMIILVFLENILYKQRRKIFLGFCILKIFTKNDNFTRKGLQSLICKLEPIVGFTAPRQRRQNDRGGKSILTKK